MERLRCARESSVELWRGVSAACRWLEQHGAGDHPSAIAGVLRACGVDDRLFDVIGMQLVCHLPSPSAAERGAAGSSPPSTPDCVVRSTSGRISLKVIPT